jgi:hypothetical protein
VLLETRLRLLKEGMYCRIKVIEVLPEPRRVELIAPFLYFCAIDVPTLFSRCAEDPISLRQSACYYSNN